MSDRFEVKITGSNQASQAFQSVTRDMEAMGRSAETTTRRMGMSFDDINRRAFAIGAALGSATLALGEFSRQAADDEAQQNRLQAAVEATGKGYEEYASAIDKAIKAGEEKAYADDATREALIRLNVVTGDTQRSLEQMGLVMDLARARGISLATAADIVGRVMGGNTAILTRYGLAVSEGATATEALAELQARVAGQSRAYADSTQGDIDRIKIAWDNLTESIGYHTGGMQELLMLLPGLTAGYTALSGAIGALGGASLLKSLGPLALGAAGAYIVSDALLNRGETGSRPSFTAVNYGFYGAGTALNQILPGNPFDTQKYLDTLASNAVEDVVKGMFFFSATDNVDNKALFDRLVTAGILPAIPPGAQIKDEQKFYEGQFIAVQEQAAAMGMSTGQYIESRLTSPGSTYVWDPVSQRYMDLGEKQIYDQTRATDARRQQALSWVHTGGPQAGMSAGAVPGLDLSGPWYPSNLDANPQMDAAAYSAERQRILAQIDQAALDFISNPGNVSQLLNSGIVSPGAPVFNRRAGGGSGGGSTTPFYMAASAAGTARDQFETGYRVTIGQTQQIASQSQGLASFAEDLVNYEGVIGRVDDLLNRGVISIDAYRTAQEDANQIFAANAEIQDDVASIQVKQLGYNAEMLSQYAETIDAIEQMGEAEQRRALAMMDSGEAAKVNEAATIAYRVAMGELSETIGTDLIEGMARADPLLADLLEQYGLIEQGADGEIRVIFPEKQNLMDGIADLSQSIQDLVDAIYEVVIKGDNSQAIESIDEAWNEVRGLDGASATVKVYADISSAWSSLTALANTAWSTTVYAGVSASNPSGGSRLHGGVVGYANGGVAIRAGEVMPELMRFANGGTAWAMNDGIYNVPRGTYVTPGPASKNYAKSSPSIVISGPVTIVANDPRQLYQSLNEYARGGSRL